MFTVKWVVKHTFGEVTRIFSAEEIAVAYRDASVPNLTDRFTQKEIPWRVANREVKLALLTLDPFDMGGRSFDTGLVYVMNDQGATVGKYLLDDRVIDSENSYPCTSTDGMPLADASVVFPQ